MKKDWAMIGYQKVMIVKSCVVSIQISTKFHDLSHLKFVLRLLGGGTLAECLCRTGSK